MKYLRLLFSFAVAVVLIQCTDNISTPTSSEGANSNLSKPGITEYILLSEMHNAGLSVLMPMVDSSWSADKIFDLAIEYVDTAGPGYGFGNVDKSLISSLKNTIKTVSADSTGLMAYLTVTGNSKLIPDMSKIMHYLSTGKIDDIKAFEADIIDSGSYTDLEKNMLLTVSGVGRYSYEYAEDTWGPTLFRWWVGGAITDGVSGLVGGFAGGAEPGDFNWNAAGWCALGGSVLYFVK